MTQRFRGVALLALAAALLPAVALAHDGGVQNGVFRSRDGGATWQQIDAESFARGVLAVAVHARDPHRLLLATDSGLFGSRNGGRDWVAEAPGLVGPAFAVAFSGDGEQALASGTRSLHRFDGKRWSDAPAPAGAAPARALVAGGVDGRVYLVGAAGLHRSDNAGRSWTRASDGIGGATVTALAVSTARPDELHALAAGRVWSSSDGARRWRADEGAPPRADALAFDRGVPTRVWLIAAGRAWRKNDAAAPWQPLGSPLPDAQARPRAIHAMNDALLVATDRGVFRSADAGASWSLLSAELPDHSESALVRDPHDPDTVYAAFTRVGAEQLRGAPDAPQQRMTSGDTTLLVAAYAGFGLLLVALGVVVRRFTRVPPARNGAQRGDMRAESSS